MFKSKRKIYLEHKEFARRLVLSRLAFFNEHYQLQFNRVAIRDTRRNWGSCSSKQNLNFNYRIIFLPPELADYLIVHELCHLAEMNHGHQFWRLVSQTLPDWRVSRRLLKKVIIK
jgi:hypothetical protein